MGVIDSVKAALASSGPNDRPMDGSQGAYWCDDCNVRIRDVDLESDPVCPNCGEEMRFERSHGRSCAC
ncbi:hypothetical protein [Natronosalvus rutilus]|uniref:Small CPxCG-related zinc finger protein n=1 Tax=Natronosalvus rutilus TaxID=2953753 RepID=A0A9E7SUN9_9EURY|nr:hypothetical protein [Natronosalvus rutilus]UTF54999.1 hypothetical protein NGM29_07030 [Natronosalvus rutilus]